MIGKDLNPGPLVLTLVIERVDYDRHVILLHFPTYNKGTRTRQNAYTWPMYWKVIQMCNRKSKRKERDGWGYGLNFVKRSGLLLSLLACLKQASESTLTGAWQWNGRLFVILFLIFCQHKNSLLTSKLATYQW